MNDFNNSNANAPKFDTTNLKRMDGVEALPSDYQGPTSQEAVSDFNLKNVQQQVGGNLISVQASSETDYAFEDGPAFTTEAGYPITDTSTINSKSIVQIGSQKNKMSVGCAISMGLLKQTGPGNYEISSKGYEMMTQQAERGQGPKQTIPVDFQAGADKETYQALDYKLGGRLQTVLMGVVTRHAQGKDGMDQGTLELLRAKLPGTDPAAVEAKLSSYIQHGVESASSWVGQQTGFTKAQVMATLEGKSANCRATYLRACVSGQPREIMAVWSAVRNGLLR